MEISSYWSTWHLNNDRANAMMVVTQSPSLNLQHFLAVIQHGVALPTVYRLTKNHPIEEIMKPFDREAAQRGEPVELLYRGQWVPAHFVGLDRNRQPVFDCEWDAFPYSIWKPENIRMAPVKRTVWVNLYKGGRYRTHESAESAHAGAENGLGQRASEILASAVLVEIEE